MPSAPCRAQSPSAVVFIDVDAVADRPAPAAAARVGKVGNMAHGNHTAVMEFKKCGKCRRQKEVTAANWKAKFGRAGVQVASNCRQCAERDKIKTRERRNGNTDKENTPLDLEDPGTSDPDPEDASDFLGVDALTPAAFHDALKAAGDISLFSALVDVSTLEGDTTDVKDVADVLADIFGEETGYRFHYEVSKVFRFYVMVSKLPVREDAARSPSIPCQIARSFKQTDSPDHAPYFYQKIRVIVDHCLPPKCEIR
ncbi:hypothetical protein GGX14DRAFT_397362 [Mycena pura]|uniref:Uncharacterized protein n=1 Tax=Mycena pura TaxID=153505 RepID=A0AAD6V988_9AGAR|nr:hypothetical protein GGX14DRAFT_397362 [Mycena pura]